MNPSDKLLIAGPWVGEFGWELFAWQGYVRALSRHYDRTVIVCRESSRGLYEDFADDFIFANATTGLADSFFMHNLDFNQFLRETLMEKGRHYLDQKPIIFSPRRIGFPPMTHFSESVKLGAHDIIPEYYKYDTGKEKKYDYIFHIRQRQLRKEDNWEFSNWEKLLDLLNVQKARVACVGSPHESAHIRGTIDLRGATMNTVLDAVSSADCAFGPSSGPMHLASLCGCPHVVWSKPENKIRYEKNWNPFDTPILFLSEFSWHPSPDYVFEKFNNWI